ncbi:glycosyl transferase [Xanthomonas phaseoli pv. phaseoli]|uniref:Glycosyl transferase n=1 Tax=Xanthomonas campestris pv. phaseoli TaxID=317013 RepID=A0AB34QL35_XANCH|nr:MULTISPECIES: glycosyltransferase [Xanthomonas]ATS20973.1 glycosyltransferase [Xanthomonas phaseoli pv. phaseoli]ATS27645.1 glycosyltransferase [Xanthomonas phaseoli pv. phaseoli]ATS31471.1 glycosyltransferase [Xanthomonas phaseoli pv. phaseoli]ATS35883.1 glycosyltransferase [Xanthomonas phaseoli pv. phaseoli]AZU12795.1 glycosyl transferase [Xanthomonas phaseoli pv. phaseoli]
MNDQAPVSARARWPLVSVLIPAFNHARFVQRCLDSVLEDPYPCKEIVIIDDGSSDATGEKISQWISEYGHRLPVHFVQRENRGVAATLNELALRARGEYLRLGASDDYLLPGGLDAQVRYLRGHPQKLAVIGDARVVDAHGQLLHGSAMRDLHRVDKNLYCSESGIRHAVIRQWAVGGAVTLLRRSAFDARSGWNESLRIEDWDFFLRLAAGDALGFIDLPVCAYRLHGGNLSKTANVPARIANLSESRQVALRCAALFDAPDRTLLHAQARYIAAKVEFLRRRPHRVAAHLVAYAWLSLSARWRPKRAARAVELA